jgi:hypothetical protein
MFKHTGGGLVVKEGELKGFTIAGANRKFVPAKAEIVGGTVVGLFDFSQFETGDTPVSPGDVLVVFSDGLTEAVNAGNDEYGDDRLQACLEQMRGRSAADILAAIMASVAEFAGGDHLRRLGHDGAVRAVVAYQHTGTGFFDSLHQLRTFGNGGGDRFFKQDRQLGRDALQRLRHMQGIRCCQNQTIGSVSGQ